MSTYTAFFSFFPLHTSPEKKEKKEKKVCCIFARARGETR